MSRFAVPATKWGQNLISTLFHNKTTLVAERFHNTNFITLMSTVETLPIRIVNPMAERLIGDPAPQNLRKTAEPDYYCPKCRTCRDRLEYPDILDCRDLIDGQRQDSVPDEEIMTMPEIVAICKEARAEIYEEEQRKKANRR